MENTKPGRIKKELLFDSFKNGEAVANKKKGHLPPMGWNSWNAFGSGNTEALTKAMVDKIVELGLYEYGYKYIVLDDGCYKANRVDGHLRSDEVKFPSGFKALSDYVHENGLKFGMYNDIGTKLCSGLEVGTAGFEEVDTKDYIDWNIDFIKVDNCYYQWDNATFSDQKNARFTFAPMIRSVEISSSDKSYTKKYEAVKDGIITGTRAYVEREYVTGIGTYDGTGPDASPVGDMSSELHFEVEAPSDGEYDLKVCYRAGCSEGKGEWLQVAVGNGNELFYDDLVNVKEEPALSGIPDVSEDSIIIKVVLAKGKNLLRLMNHRRQENTLMSYATIQEGFMKAAPDNDIIFSICEWGKTQPQNWGYKVGDTWRILNDITFQVGSDGDKGQASWEGAYTTSVTAQYNKAVIMDEFAGLDKGWNDPDMLMIGMNGLNETMCKTHMTMWCMLNAPLFLGMDLRNVNKGDEVFNIITNKNLIALNQDSLGVQAKRIYTTKAYTPDTAYIRDNDRIDVLAKPLGDGSIALSFVNVGMGDRGDVIEIDKETIKEYIGRKMVNADKFFGAASYEVTDLWSGEKSVVTDGIFKAGGFKACDNVTVKITPCEN
ncbi:alpha-galactosidase [Eubacterium ruminantium]|uniref:Alpha-galactosidase n=1 Tax=Eubacterium ruminantium TaxID=42322 RepID=A0A1T4N342_9FIRM|nr:MULTISPECIES: alpha-galactosidase [Eubacterium]MCR5367252.1 glycoside hydrolase family 27 protein [Eubacterium sp.]SCW51544.1 alpha-galactosidase [Eubacterium ruminantium]SDM67256.1 alpha-galactosidase [Eubacterium ruminantium]SJZ73278.1 alpha-galactosidase [Eubacterium ruminantium]